MGYKVIPRGNMRKTTIELTADQYFFLKEKALELQKQNQNGSIVSIIRELVEKDRQEWASPMRYERLSHGARGKKERRG